MEYQGYYSFPPQQNYFQQQNYPQFTESDDMEEPDLEEAAAATTYRPLRSSCGTRPPSGPAKPTTPSPSKPRSPPPPESRPLAPTHAPVPNTCRQHNVVGCERCILPTTPIHHCQALIAICQDCGQHHPVVADACLAHCKGTNMPVADALLEDKPVQVLRDTGCSTVIARGSLVSETKLTGQEARMRPH